MFWHEAEWITRALGRVPGDALMPLLNLGSSDRKFRAVIQPWIESALFAPLAARAVAIVHSDLKSGEGIDVSGDIFDDRVFETLRGRGFRCVLICNILEHVVDPARFARRCEDLVAVGGYIVVTVPLSYPYHRDPIDTLYRPTAEEVAGLFARSRVLEAAVIEPGSYRDDLRRRPWIILRQIVRAPFPFLGYTRWKRSMKKIYWLFNNYRITCVVLQRAR
ncbi:MAG: hypothetical protein FJX67_13635 [Alphaproteobacteria bacterium]|nr:hypothetical protein [Alphaproteobacteria bacterium]